MNIASTPAPVLLADVGGTHVRFALADVARTQPLVIDSIRAYNVADFATFIGVARGYLGEIDVRPQSGVFAFAGPVDGDAVHMTNHPWTVSRTQVCGELALEAVHFINDFAAMSLCIPLLSSEDLRVIGPVAARCFRASREQTFAIVGPGTGLGVGALLLRAGSASALETEGGHIAFAPGSDEEIEILRCLQARFGRVSYERVLSGSGLVNVHRALREIGGTHGGDLAAEEITGRAEGGADATCVRTVEVFCQILGALAGDFALAFGAWDGVYISGGMAPIVLPWLEAGDFRRRFENKGRFASRLARVPSIAIMHPQAGLLGAAAFAVQDSGRSLLGARGASNMLEK